MYIESQGDTNLKEFNNHWVINHSTFQGTNSKKMKGS